MKRSLFVSMMLAVVSFPALATENDTDKAETAAASQTASSDEMAADLNAQQSIRQTFTVTRTLNGSVVETARREVTPGRQNALRPTEAGQSLAEAVRASFDRELLTRTEAYDEAKLDFALGDVNLDKMIDAEEFIRLAGLLRIEFEEINYLDPGTGTSLRGYGTPLKDQSAPVAERRDSRAYFQSLTGPAATTLDERGFVLGFLREFDLADANADGLLSGNELRAFRTSIRNWSGE